jgi:hypothetical protein
MSSRTRGFPRPVLLLILLAVGLLAAITTLFWSPYSALFWQFAPREKIQVLVPDGYEGPVLIAYQVPDGVQAERDDDVWLYRLQPDGALLLKNDPPRFIVQMSFWYTTESGELHPIPQNPCFLDSVAEGVVVCPGTRTEVFNYQRLRPNQNFYVAHLSDKQGWTYEVYTRLLRRYLDRLALPHQE